LGLPVVLDDTLALPHTTGYRPCRIRGEESGFELFVDTGAALLAHYPGLKGRVTPTAKIISFRWGGDLLEGACAMAAAAALLQQWQAIVYYPEDDVFYDLDRLKRDFADCIAG
jgi:hypothetical protein